MMKLFIVILVAFIATTVDAFGVVPRGSPIRPSATTTTTTSLQTKHWLDAIDEMCIENVAEYCLEEQCEVEEKLALINQLTDQRDLMKDAAKRIDSLISRLKMDTTVIKKEDKEKLESLMEAVCPEEVL
jgi:hypothetical protein